MIPICCLLCTYDYRHDMTSQSNLLKSSSTVENVIIITYNIIYTHVIIQKKTTPILISTYLMHHFSFYTYIYTYNYYGN